MPIPRCVEKLRTPLANGVTMMQSRLSDGLSLRVRAVVRIRRPSCELRRRALWDESVEEKRSAFWASWRPTIPAKTYALTLSAAWHHSLKKSTGRWNRLRELELESAAPFAREEQLAQDVKGMKPKVFFAYWRRPVTSLPGTSKEALADLRQ
jgi:hypothetical protein